MHNYETSPLELLIQQLKAEPIDEVMELITDIPYKPLGEGTAGPDDDTCPFCGHHDCFRLKLDGESSYGYCFSCGSGGDVVALVAKLWGVSNGAAAYRLAEVLQESGSFTPGEPRQLAFRFESPQKVVACKGIPTPTERQLAILEELARLTSEHMFGTNWALEYQTQTRGHSEEALRAFRVGYLTQRPSALLFRSKLKPTNAELMELGLLNSKGRDLLIAGLYLYPHVDRLGRVCRFSQKDPKRDWEAQQSSRGYLGDITFFGEHTLADIQEEDPIALVEGENDLLSLFDAGWKGGILGCQGGLNRRQIEWLNRECPDKRIVTFFDADEAGDSFRQRTVSGLKVAALEHYKVPAGKDIDEYLKQGGTLDALLVPENLWQPTPLSPPEETPRMVYEALVAAAGRSDVLDVTPLDHARAVLKCLDIPVAFIVEHKDWATCTAEGHWQFACEYLALNKFGAIGDRWRKAALAFPIPNKRKEDWNREEKENHKRREKCLELAFELGKLNGLTELMKLATKQSSVRRSFTEFDANPVLLGVRNGAVDIQKGQFFLPAPEQLISKSCNTAYDPKATCPNWMLFLDHLTGHLHGVHKEKMLKLLQRIAGTSLLFKRVRRRFFFLSGPPGSGKSVFVNTLSELLGDYGVTLPTESLMASSNISHGARPDLLPMIGARMIVVCEAGDKYCFDDEKIKAMTGGDPISARGLYQDQVRFIVGGNIVITGNSFPRSQTGGPAFMQRIQIVMFPNAIAEERQDPHLVDKLKAEYPGILNWALEGAREELQGIPLQVPECVREATHRYRESGNPVELFLDECCLRGEEQTIRKNELLAAYNKWAKENGFPEYGSNRFTTHLANLNISVVRPNGGLRCYKGVALATDSIAYNAWLEQREKEAAE